MSKIDLNILRDRAYKIACDHGFHKVELSNEHWFCLVVSELMEAVEADRKDDHFVELNDIDNYIRACLINKEQAFEAYIKDIVEDELADAAIRLLDLAGLRNIKINAFSDDDIEDSSESCNDETFTESIYAISTIPIKHEYEYDANLDKQVNSMLLAIFGLAKHLDIDIMWHIEQKMKYNKLRSHKHGKQY